MSQLAEQITAQPVGLGPIQLMQICGFTDMKDQVECLSEACTVSGMQEGTFLGDGIYKGSMFSFLTAKGISNMIYPHSSNKLYLASNRLNLVRYFQLFLLVEVRWYSQGY